MELLVIIFILIFIACLPMMLIAARTGYGKYEDVTECRICKKRSDYRSMNPVNPCPDCGGSVIKHTGRYNYDTNEWEIKND